MESNILQGSDEWFAIRKGKMTASHAQAVGNCGKGLDTYITEIMAEFYSSGEKEQFTSKHIERGNELEPLARSMYELETGNDVKEVGFIEMNEYAGCSPDGLINEDGLIEIKCVDDVSYFKHLLNGIDEVDTKYIWQVQMQLLITGREWCDLCVYCPNFRKSMSIFRVYPDKEKHEKLKKGIAKGIELIKQIKEKINDVSK